MIFASATVHTSFASVQNSTEMTTEPHSSAMQKNRLNVQCSMTCKCSANDQATSLDCSRTPSQTLAGQQAIAFTGVVLTA